MTRITRTLLFLSLFLSACTPGGISPPVTSSPLATDTPLSDTPPVATTEVLPPPELVVTVSTPAIEPGPHDATTVAPPDQLGCAYQWAYQDMPELSSEFLRSIQEIQPEAQASAYAFGENCIRADGTSTFGAMETDFNITLQVTDLSSDSELGDWIVKVMEVITSIPPDQIMGPRPGRVSMTYQSSGEQKTVNFYIDQYQALPPGLSGAEIYQALQVPQ